jgi:antitoxin component YwqK of YwqJK toxin-antitoxin module
MISMRLIAASIFYFLISTLSIAQSENGITGEGKMKDGHKVGKWVYTCDETGEEIGKESYDGDGKLHGYSEWFNCEGKRKAEYNYDHGKLLGKQKEYHADGKLKVEWVVIDMPKKCQRSKEDKNKRIIESFYSYYENGQKEIVWEGDPCGRYTVTKYRSTNGTEWEIKFDDNNQYQFGPRVKQLELIEEFVR